MSIRIIKYREMESPIGTLVLADAGRGLCHIEFGRFTEETASRLQRWSDRWYGESVWAADPAVLEEEANQLQAYFRGERTGFDLQLDMQGTPFQLKVWQRMFL